MRFLIAGCAILIFAQCSQQNKGAEEPLKATVYELSNGTKTSTYKETIAYYQHLASVSSKCTLLNIGQTDSQEPLHLILWSYDGEISLSGIGNRLDKKLIFINNGIHPGEPDGVDACQLLLKRLISDSAFARKHSNTVLAIVPIYNVGGSINRNSTTRVNQNGPESYGFRGNAHNYDLNRDFVKMDSKNAWSFTRVFTQLDPDLFIDTHVSNGADYPYNITLLSNHQNKFRSELETFLQTSFTPLLYKTMAEKGEKMVPYVNVHGTDPRAGITEFLDHPRYSNGFAAIHSCPAYTIETHMLKSHKTRTEATLKLLETFLESTTQLGDALSENRKKEKHWFQLADSIPTAFNLLANSDSLLFEGYAYEAKYSEIFDRKLMQYDRDKTYKNFIPHRHHYGIKRKVKKPKSYYIQAGYHQIISRLINNGIKGEYLDKDSLMHLTVQKIESFETIDTPFEGHYLHYNTRISEVPTKVQLRKGDFIIHTQENNARLLAEYLDPVAPDSYFNWGFFDIILQQKEGYSAYVWQNEAAKMLENDDILRDEFETKKADDVEFKNNFNAQLYWLYQQSNHFEKAYKRLPVFLEY
jgi:hypothetical protein